MCLQDGMLNLEQGLAEHYLLKYKVPADISGSFLEANQWKIYNQMFHINLFEIILNCPLFQLSQIDVSKEHDTLLLRMLSFTACVSNLWHFSDLLWWEKNNFPNYHLYKRDIFKLDATVHMSTMINYINKYFHMRTSIWQTDVLSSEYWH